MKRIFKLDDFIITLSDNGDVSVDPPKGTSPSDLIASEKCLSLAEMIHSIRVQGYESKLLLPALEASISMKQFRGFIYSNISKLKDLKDTSMWVNGRLVTPLPKVVKKMSIME